MKEYIFLIKSRLKSPRFLKLLYTWQVLRIKKLLQIDFDLPFQTDYKKIDLVIPTISKDFEILKTVIEAAKKHVRNEIENIYIVSKKDGALEKFCNESGFVFINEDSVLGYGKNTIDYTVHGVDRSGWMFQQLLKLSGELFVKNDDYLVIDSDTILINPHSFIENDKFVFLQSEEWHEPYFESFQMLFGYPAKTALSYISHMMIFNCNLLKQMKIELEEKQQMNWDKAYSSTANNREASCVSDYDTYANWVRHNHPQKFINRIFYNRGLPRTDFGSLIELEEKFSDKYNSVSFHSYIK